jgi:hypothetical protein
LETNAKMPVTAATTPKIAAAIPIPGLPMSLALYHSQIENAAIQKQFAHTITYCGRVSRFMPQSYHNRKKV